MATGWHCQFVSTPTFSPSRQLSPALSAREAEVLLRMLGALVIPLVAAGVQHLLWSKIQPFVWFLFYPAVFFSSWVGRKIGGLLATGFSLLLVWFVFMPPRFSFEIENASSAYSMLMFSLMGVLLAEFHARLAETRQRAREHEQALNEANARLEQRVAARTAELERANAELIASKGRLKSSKAQLEAALESMTDAVFISDVTGRFVEFNTAFATIHRFKDKEACAKTFQEYPAFLDVFMADGQPAPLEMWAVPRALRGETAKNAEYFLRRRDTGESWAGSYSFAPIRDDAGSIVGGVVVGRDITETKRAEEALRLSEEKFATAFSQNPAAIALTRLTDGVFIDVNPTWERLIGYPRSEAVGCSARQMRIWPSPEAAARFFDLLQKHGTVQDYEQEFLKKSGEPFLAQLSARVLEFRGEILILSTLIDLTAHKQAEAALRDSEARLRLSVWSGNIGLWDWDLMTNDVVFSPVWKSQLGYTDEEISNRFEEWQTRVHPDDLQPTLQKLQSYLAHPVGRHEVEHRMRHKDGSYRWIRALADLLRDASGKPIRMLGCHIDITESRAAADALAQVNADLERRVADRTVELQAANSELESFSYSVSHDLRAPLRAMDGFAQAVVEDFSPQLPAEAQRKLQVIRESAQQMGRLIDDLLAFSRLGRHPLDRQRVEVGPLVRDCLNSLADECRSRKVRLEVGDLPACEGDRALLRQVWLNLLSNALKYTRRCDEAIVQLGARTEGSETVYFVRDNGCGFDMRYAGKLFGVFQRLHRADDYEGTGVGLAIVQRIVHRHGGRVWAEAAVGRGATFQFTLGTPARS